MASNQLAIPFRKGTHLSLNNAIRAYVTDKYGQHPDSFREAIDVIDSLRRDAVNVREAHTTGIRRLQAYAAQLAFMEGKFPLEIGADFTWYPALGYNTERPVVQNNLRFERVNILYNLAALYSQLAVGTSHADPAGLKTAASWFMQAAGVLQFVRETFGADPDVAGCLADDLDAATLTSLEQLMLAQAQECFWLRAVSEKYKDATIAKLAARLSDLYGAAGEAALQSDAISRAWIHHASAKHHHFAAAAQYRAALDCLEKQRYGEEIARLKDALACVAEGLKETRGGYLAKPVADDLAALKGRLEDDLKRAERDNDMIYLQIVPPKSDLKLLDRANMATPRVPPQVATPLAILGSSSSGDAGEGGNAGGGAGDTKAEFGPPLFSELVPFAVHLAVSVYEERRDRLVHQNILHDLDALTTQLHETLVALDLPGALQAADRPLGLPGSLVQHAEEIRYADGVERVRRSFADIDKLRAADRAVFDEGRALLAAESDEDTQLRRRYGTARWTRPAGREDDSLPSTAATSDGNNSSSSSSNSSSSNSSSGRKLYATADEIEGYFASSGSSDGVVRAMFADVEPLLAVLAGPERGLLDFVPNSRRVVLAETDPVKPALGRLRSAYNDVQRLESRRRRRAEALRDKARQDDVRPDMLRETARLERAYPQQTIVAPHFDGFFAARLRDRYDEDEAAVAREAADQAKAVEDVTRASRAFAAAQKQSGSSGGREREAALQKLANAHYKYKEVVRNVEVGRKFYNDLATIVGAFRDQCQAWVQQRRSEARALEEELNMPVLAPLSLGPPQPPPAQQPPAPSTQNTYYQNYPQQPVPSQRHQMWTPAAGIRFGASPPPPSAQTGAAAPSSAGAGPPQPGGGTAASGTWDPSSGIRFG